MQHITFWRSAGLAAVAAIVLGACAGSQPQAPAQPQPPAAAVPAGPAVQVTNSPLGTILTNAEGFTLYAFDNDESTKPQSSCNDVCATTWPPLAVAVDGAGPTASGLDPSLLGTSSRADGSTQVVVNDWPLYRFSGDQAPGDTNGQRSGGVWWVVGSDGKLIRGDQAESAGAAAVHTTESPLGTILTDAEGFTLYAFDNDEPTKPQSSCQGACVETWPPLLAGDNLITADGFDQALLGISPRSDGTVQLTANQWPLYRFSGDQAPGDTNGQGSGGKWWVVGTDGKPIRDGAAPAAAPAPAPEAPAEPAPAPAPEVDYSY